MTMTKVTQLTQRYTSDHKDRNYRAFDEERRVLERLGIKLIQDLVNQGREYITLDELYITLRATTPGEKNGIQYSVLRMKTKNIIETIKGQQAIYKVV